MKLNIRIPIMLSMLTAISIGSCNNNSEQRVQNAKDDVDKARLDLNTAENKYANEWNQFKKDVDERINHNEVKIGQLKEQAEKKKGQEKTDLKKKIEMLEQRNQVMQEKLAAYKDDGKEDWESFKNDFNRSMDELGESLEN